MSLSVLLRLTVSGSGLALLLLATRYVFFKKMPSTAYYYAWLLVLLRFVLPLPGLMPDMTGESAAPAAALSARASWEDTQLAPADSDQPMGYDALAARPPLLNAGRAGAPAGHGRDLKSPALWLSLWGVGAGICLAAYVLSYALFTARVRRSASPATEADRRVYARLPGKKPGLCRCAAYDTPLMFGVFHPMIALPERDYDAALLTNILRHELTHYRRRDPLYKWFAVAALSTQWFNPLAWLIRRELNRACELSCDEWLLRGMDREDKLSYGNTLLSMAESAALPAGVVATTFSTEKRNLKERLEQIMSYKKNNARILAAALALALLLGCGIAAGPAAVAAPSDGEGETVRVSSVDGLLSAIAPDTVIELAAGTYDLSSASDYGQDTHSPYYSWNGAYDGFELDLHNVQNLTLRGAGKGETVLSAVPRYANVLKITGCRNVSVEALTAGHTQEPGWCQGGVLYFESTDGAVVSDCGLYGCGILGVRARDCSALTVKDSEIYECSFGAVDVHQCRDTRVEGCDIHDHGTREGEGEALNLFSVSYSEGFTVYNCRIHDNRAQNLLNSSYTKSALFLSCDVTGNAFGSAVFSFRQYGAAVDGCRFEGNDVSHGWYTGDGVHASDLDGDALEDAELAEMTLRDIPPERVSPKSAGFAPTAEVPVGGEVLVKTVDELLAAIGPDRTIILDGGLFELSTASNYGGIGTAYYYWKENPDGPGLVIHDVSGLSIRAKDTASGAVTLAALPRYADVLGFRNCDNLFLGGFTAGHTQEPGVCSGGVLYFENCSQVTIEKMRLYGCGILGIQASRCTSMEILRTEIYECSQGAAQFYQTDGIIFDSCGVHDVPSPALVFTECGDKSWNGVPLSGLNGMYDVDADGSLIVYETPRREENADTLVMPVEPADLPAWSEAVMTPEEAEQAALREIEEWKRLGILNPELSFNGSADAVVEIPESVGSENWYGRLFPQSYDVHWHVGPGDRAGTEQHKYGCNLRVDALSGKIVSAYIDAMADADAEPVREAVHREPLDPRNPQGESKEWTLCFYDNFEDIFPADMTVERFCKLLAEYWGFTGFRLAETVDDMYFDEPQPPVAADSLLKDMNADTRDNYYLTVFFEGDQPGAPMYIQLHQFPGYVTLSLGVNGHAVG